MHTDNPRPRYVPGLPGLLLVVIAVAVVASGCATSGSGGSGDARESSSSSDAIATPLPQTPYEQMGDALLGQGKIKQALLTYKQALESGADPASANYRIGYAFLLLKSYKNAKIAFQRALENDEDLHLAREGIGLASFEMGDMEAARAAFLKTREAAPDHWVPYAYLAAILHHEGEATSALEHFNLAIRLGGERNMLVRKTLRDAYLKAQKVYHPEVAAANEAKQEALAQAQAKRIQRIQQGLAKKRAMERGEEFPEPEAAPSGPPTTVTLNPMGLELDVSEDYQQTQPRPAPQTPAPQTTDEEPRVVILGPAEEIDDPMAAYEAATNGQPRQALRPAPEAPDADAQGGHMEITVRDAQGGETVIYEDENPDRTTARPRSGEQVAVVKPAPRPKTPEVEPKSKPEPEPIETPGGFAILESSWPTAAGAQKRMQELEAMGLEPRMVLVDLGERGVWRRVVLGSFTNAQAADRMIAILTAEFGLRNVTVVKVE